MRRVLLALAAALAVGGCGDTTASEGNGAPVVKEVTRQPDKPRPRTAAAALERLSVKGRAPKTGYDREQFGGDWASVGGCDMRNRTLARAQRDVVYDAGSACEVASGTLSDPYTGARIRYVSGDAREVDVDHVVALGDAWQKGAQQWSYARRVRFANDPLNLLVVDASANRQKGDGDAATWLPPNKGFRCDYVARQIAVKRRYKAWVTRAEKDAMNRVLSACPAQKLPTVRRARYFENCDAVRAAGAAPLTRGDGNYEDNAQMDRDGDGVACE